MLVLKKEEEEKKGTKWDFWMLILDSDWSEGKFVSYDGGAEGKSL